MDGIPVWLRANDQYLIVTHDRPDGDGLGSAAALCAGLRAMGKTACMAGNPDITERYIPYIQAYIAAPDYPFRHVIVVDAAARKRLPPAQRDVSVDACVDHHLASDERLAPLQWVDSDRAACGEMIFDLLKVLGVTISPEIALPLYLSISTDTGCFRFSNTTARTHEITAELLRAGIDIAPVNSVMFDLKSRTRLKIEAHIYENLRYYMDGKLALGVLGMDFIRSVGAVEDDLDAISNLPRRVEGVEIGVMLREERSGADGSGREYKMSVRTSRHWRADRIAARLGGGGHARAAGAVIEAPLEAAVEAILDAVGAA